MDSLASTAVCSGRTGGAGRRATSVADTRVHLDAHLDGQRARTESPTGEASPGACRGRANEKMPAPSDEHRGRPEAGVEAPPLVEERRRGAVRRAGRRRWPCSRSRRSSRPCRRRRRRGSGTSGRRSSSRTRRRRRPGRRRARSSGRRRRVARSRSRPGTRRAGTRAGSRCRRSAAPCSALRCRKPGAAGLHDAVADHPDREEAADLPEAPAELRVRRKTGRPTTNQTSRDAKRRSRARREHVHGAVVGEHVA